jgi:hypothetical protein
MYNMYKASVSPGSVQQIMPYLQQPPILRQSSHLNGRMLGRSTDIVSERSERTRRKHRLRHLFYCRVTYHVIITRTSHWSAGRCPAENGLLLLRNRYCCLTSLAHAPYSITSHVHAPTRRKRFPSTVASSCWGTTWPLFRNALSKSATILKIGRPSLEYR